MQSSQFHMIDISDKEATRRIAIARGSFFADPKTVLRIRDRSLPKGDVLVLSEIAGINGAKNCSQWLPLCHPLLLNSIFVSHEIFSQEVRVRCEVRTTGKTGVEMEALCGVQAALLCIYDLTKNIDPDLRIGDVFLERKEGGKSGVYQSPFLNEGSAAPSSESESESECTLEGLNVGLITLSDRCSQGTAVDQSTVEMEKWFTKRQARVSSKELIPDDVNTLFRVLEKTLTNQVSSSISEDASDDVIERPGLIILSGGTGLGPRDLTPEAIVEFAKKRSGKEIPGIGEKLRYDGSEHTPFSYLSRSLGYLIQGTVVIALPGSPKAVVQGLDSLSELFSHFLHVLGGGRHT